MSYPAAAIANYFLDLAEAEEKTLDPLKLQKLVFFAHGWSLALWDQDLIDEQIEAWKFGPVIRSLFDELCSYGNEAVSNRICSSYYGSSVETLTGMAGNIRDFHMHCPSIDDQPTEAERVSGLLKRIWDVYGGFTGGQLSNMTRMPDTPWQQVNQEYQGQMPKGTDIPRNAIRDYFRRLSARHKAEKNVQPV